MLAVSFLCKSELTKTQIAHAIVNSLKNKIKNKLMQSNLGKYLQLLSF